MAEQQSLPVSIIPLDGPFVGRTISLVNRALPYRPITFEGKQRVKTTWYPGNPVATQQLMGPTEEPTVIMGTWKDIFLGNGVARALMQTFDDLRRSGTLVEFRWGMGTIGGGGANDPEGQLQTVGDAIVRRGLITRTKWAVERPQDVPFEIEFTWRGRDEAVQPPVQTAGLANPREGFTQLTGAAQQFEDALDAYQNLVSDVTGFQQKIQGQIDQSLGTLQKAVDGLQGLTGAVTATADLLPNTATQALGLATSILNTAQEFSQTILGIPLVAQELKDDATDTLLRQNVTLGLLEQSSALQETAIVTINAIQAYQVPDVVAEVSAPAGTDLHDLARQFYGNPDLWWMIAQYNGFPTSVVPAFPTGVADEVPQAVQIPRRIDGAAGDLRFAGC